MKNLTRELKLHNLTDAQIKRINATLNKGKTVHTTHVPAINSIYLNDKSTVTLVMIDSNGNEREIERKWQ